MAPPRSRTMDNNNSLQGGVNNLNKNKKRHGWTVLIFIFGTLFPPLAVAARFGIGKDFWINLPLTIAGYIPGHVHNFYIQNIRNNKTNARTPKWAIRYGLVDSSKIERNARKREWANRFNDRDASTDYDTLPVEEGQVPDAPRPPPKGPSAAGGGDAPLWRPEDEGYYGEGSSNRRGGPNASSASLESGSRGSGRWHYPANFDDAAEVEPSRKKSKSKSKSSGGKDRWARAEEARLSAADPSEQDGRRKKKKSSRRSTVDSSSSYRGPEDAVGGAYGSRPAAPAATGDDSLNHEF